MKKCSADEKPLILKNSSLLTKLVVRVDDVTWSVIWKNFAVLKINTSPMEKSFAFEKLLILKKNLCYIDNILTWKIVQN